MSLDRIREELYTVDRQILTLELKRKELLEKIHILKKGVSPLYAPEVEKIKRDGLLKDLKKRIEEGFVNACKIQIEKASPNPLFAIDDKEKNLSWLKIYASGTTEGCKFLFSLRPTGYRTKRNILIRQRKGVLRQGVHILAVASSKTTFFRKKIFLYGKDYADLKEVQFFLETLGATVQVTLI
ncbi:MAG: hypothetical protein FJZ61_05255 [Chlamydiae bacterium]|nr:hypothetical protein [Chlamydiota bacterium]